VEFGLYQMLQFKLLLMSLFSTQAFHQGLAKDLLRTLKGLLSLSFLLLGTNSTEQQLALGLSCCLSLTTLLTSVTKEHRVRL
jgi:hypothetical protein